MSIRVGTSGWAYTAWKPGFYPPKLPSKDFLKFYSTQLNAVEVNYTFRRFLTEKVIAGWIEQTPETFHFVVKAHQVLTHIKRLKDAEESLKRFLDSIAPLEQAHRLGPVLFQLPPNFKADAERVDSFLALVPRASRVAFEFRHESWFSDEIYDVLKRRNAALCVAETDDFQTPEVFTADFAYFRLRRSEYSPTARKKIAEDMRRHSTGQSDVYSFFKHEENPDSPNWAREVLQAAAPESRA
jgi:uncharacterized protein YecE (DUF72 family)